MRIVSNSENKSVSQILLIELMVQNDKGDCGEHIYICATYHLKLRHQIHFDEAKYVHVFF